MDGDVAVPERELGRDAVDARDVPVGDDLDRPLARYERAEELERSELAVDARRGEHDPVRVVRTRVRDGVVQILAFGVERVEALLVAGERAPAALHAPPRLVGVDVEQHREGRAREHVPCLLRPDGAASELEHDRLGAAEQRRRHLLLDRAERLLPARVEDLLDCRPGARLDRVVEADEAPPEPLCDNGPERRLAGAHEAGESEVPAERVQLRGHWMRSRYARWAATKSWTASPPNLSQALRASSQATAASATTASASTAWTSLRSTSA